MFGSMRRIRRERRNRSKVYVSTHYHSPTQVTVKKKNIILHRDQDCAGRVIPRILDVPGVSDEDRKIALEVVKEVYREARRQNKGHS